MSINWDFIIILAIFLINIYIIKSEYKYKKIPNILLVLLLIFNIIFIFFSKTDIYLIPSLIKISLLISGVFFLLFFKIWNPSYLKYIFVSSLFFLGVGEITYISNIFFLIFLYIIFYFFFYYLKILLNYKKLQTYSKALKEKMQGEFNSWLIKNKENVTSKIVITILGFFAVFILIRLLRIYVQGEISHFFYIIKIENITINTVIFALVGMFIITKYLYTLYNRYFSSNYKNLIALIILTISFLIYEFIYDYEFISVYLHKILTFLLLIFIIAVIILRMGKYLFFDNDSKVINYKELKTGDIIDKKIISQYLVGQKSLEDENVGKYIKSIKNPINKKDCEKIINLIEKNNTFLEKKGDNPSPNIIRIYNTFLFTPFIFGSFLITLLIGKNMLLILIYESFMRIMSLGK